MMSLNLLKIPTMSFSLAFLEGMIFVCVCVFFAYTLLQCKADFVSQFWIKCMHVTSGLIYGIHRE